MWQILYIHYFSFLPKGWKTATVNTLLSINRYSEHAQGCTNDLRDGKIIQIQKCLAPRVMVFPLNMTIPRLHSSSLMSFIYYPLLCNTNHFKAFLIPQPYLCTIQEWSCIFWRMITQSYCLIYVRTSSPNFCLYHAQSKTDQSLKLTVRCPH